MDLLTVGIIGFFRCLIVIVEFLIEDRLRQAAVYVKALDVIILGVALAAVGYVWLQDALDARHAGVEKWWIYMIAALLSLLFAVLYFYSPITEKGRGLILLFEGICSLVLLIMRKSIDKTAEVERGEAPKTKAAKMEKAEEAKDEEPKIEKAEEAKAEEPKADE